MMKLISSLLIVTCVGLVIACGSNSSSNNGSQTASTPQPCNNIGMPGSNPNCQAYQPYYANQQVVGPYGNWYWPNAYQPAIGNCGCNPGYRPVQGPFGTACAPQAYFGAYNLVYYNYGYVPGYWGAPQNNAGFMTTPQATYNPNTNSCQQSTARGCDVRANNCPSGAHCQPVGGGSTIGLCVQ